MNNGKTGGTTDNKEEIISAATNAIRKMLDSIDGPIKSWSVISRYGLDIDHTSGITSNSYNGTATFSLEINGGEQDNHFPEPFKPFVPPVQQWNLVGNVNPIEEIPPIRIDRVSTTLDWVEQQLSISYLTPLTDLERGHMAAHIPLVTGRGVSQHYLKMSDPELIEEYRHALRIQRERILENNKQAKS